MTQKWRQLYLLDKQILHGREGSERKGSCMREQRLEDLCFSLCSEALVACKATSSYAEMSERQTAKTG
jgi:hypothetical protein